MFDPRSLRLKAPSTPATMSKQQATLSKLRSTLLPQKATMSNEISSFRKQIEHVQFVMDGA